MMELATRETLAERIKRGPIPMHEALPIAKQIAEELQAAHEHEMGVVHRDLKPADSKVTLQGARLRADKGVGRRSRRVNLDSSGTGRE